MKYLIVYAHPSPKSFNHALLEAVTDKLKKSGHEIAVRDLYNTNFKPALEGADFVALGKGQPLNDVAEEQRHVKWADKIVFIHPVWWFGMPAILKGYIDRVFSKGFAYDYAKDGLKGLLTGKSVIVFNTTGGSAGDYEKYGFNTALKATQDNGIYGLCGLKVELHKFFYAIPTSSPEELAKILREVGILLDSTNK
jgi:NAD(P)H dehydrogenase (quinone)